MADPRVADATRDARTAYLASAVAPSPNTNEVVMSERITKARAAVEAVVARYSTPSMLPHARRALTVVLDEFHNAVVEAVTTVHSASGEALDKLLVATPKFDEVQATLASPEGDKMPLGAGVAAADAIIDTVTTPPVEVATPKFDEVQAPSDPYAKAADAISATPQAPRVEGAVPELAAPYEPEVLSGCAVRAEAQREAVAEEAPKGKRYRK